MTKTQQPEALRLAGEYRKTMPSDVMHLWADDVVAELRRLYSYVTELESEAQANARIIGASAENELALRARVQELQRRVAKLENELSVRPKNRV